MSSLDCLEGCSEAPLSTFPSLIRALNAEFNSQDALWEMRRERIEGILSTTTLDLTEINRFSHFSTQKELPYSRNLVHADADDRFALLILCWNPSYESKIHTHPVQGCFVVPLRGTIFETIYALESDGTVTETETRTYSADKPGVSFMADSLGIVHKIGDPSACTPAVTLHLYCPSYSTCQVWAAGATGQSEERTLSFFSRNGIRDADETMLDPDYFI